MRDGLNRCHLKVEKDSSPPFVRSQPTEDEDRISQPVPPFKVFDDLWGHSGYSHIRKFASMRFNPSRASRKGVLPRSVPYLAPWSYYTYLPISLATGSERYSEDIAHSTSSAEQNSTCAVNPSSVDDLSTIVRRFFCPFKRSYLTLLNVFQIKIIGRDDIRAPFAVSRQFIISS